MAQAPLYNEEIVATRIACEDLVIDGHIFISGDNPADIRVNLNKDGLFFTEMEVDGSASSVAVYSKTGVVLKDRVSIFSDPFSNGGSILIRNRTGDLAVVIEADEHGNGKVGAYNRRGKGKVLKAPTE